MPLRGLENFKTPYNAIKGIDRTEQPEKLLLTVRNIRCVMNSGIRVEIDSHRAGIGMVVEGNRKIVDRSQRKIVCNGLVTSKAEAVVERHDVGANPEQGAPIVKASRIPS